MSDESRWSTRYYRADCPELRILMKTNGRDDRPDPTGPLRCLMPDHGGHSLIRISPDHYEQLAADDDDDIECEAGEEEAG